eukprot:4195016-Prorocentrum_lima.AAC.1
MTSSLVGSEMCIRDRSASASGSVTNIEHKNRSASSGGVAAKVPSFSAVSYTHLTLPTICSV